MINEALHWDMSNKNFCLWDWNLETGTIGISKNWLDILGIEVEDYEPSSRWFNNLIHPEDLQMVLFQLESHLSGETNQMEFNFRLKNKYHQYIEFESRGMIVLQKEEGTPGHVIWASEKVIAMAS